MSKWKREPVVKEHIESRHRRSNLATTTYDRDISDHKMQRFNNQDKEPKISALELHESFTSTSRNTYNKKNILGFFKHKQPSIELDPKNTLSLHLEFPNLKRVTQFKKQMHRNGLDRKKLEEIKSLHYQISLENAQKNIKLLQILNSMSLFTENMKRDIVKFHFDNPKSPQALEFSKKAFEVIVPANKATPAENSLKRAQEIPVSDATPHVIHETIPLAEVSALQALTDHAKKQEEALTDEDLKIIAATKDELSNVKPAEKVEAAPVVACEQTNVSHDVTCADVDVPRHKQENTANTDVTPAHDACPHDAISEHVDCAHVEANPAQTSCDKTEVAAAQESTTKIEAAPVQEPCKEATSTQNDDHHEHNHDDHHEEIVITLVIPPKPEEPKVEPRNFPRP